MDVHVLTGVVSPLAYRIFTFFGRPRSFALRCGDIEAFLADESVVVFFASASAMKFSVGIQACVSAQRKISWYPVRIINGAIPTFANIYSFT